GADGSPPLADLPAFLPNPDPVGDGAFVDTAFKYDILNNPVEVLQEAANGAHPEFLRTRYRYDPDGNQVLVIQPEGNATASVYDGFNRRTSIIDSVGNQTVFQYDPAGNMVRVSRFGPVGGASPTSDGPDALPGPVSIGGVIQAANLVNSNLLESTETLYDEL